MQVKDIELMLLFLDNLRIDDTYLMFFHALHPYHVFYGSPYLTL